MDTLVIIPARGGSKGVPLKNIKLLHGIPLIHYSIDLAKTFIDAKHICVSTDSDEIISCVEEKGLHVPFKRPDALASDTAGTYEVLLHALDYYAGQGINYNSILLLQPTSPFRLPNHLLDIKQLYNDDLDMVASVGVCPYNPYFSIFEEDGKGFLQKSKNGNFERRQDSPQAYYLNGSLYFMNVASIRAKPLHAFTKVKKYVMDELFCQDIDTPLDFLFCETIIEQGLYKHAYH